MELKNKGKKIKIFIKNLFSKKITFNALKDFPQLFMYAGDIPDLPQYDKYFGLSIKQSNNRHIKHDITQKHNLNDNSVDIYQIEDVIEHIPFEKIPEIIDDIYRILKPGGIFRLSLPDYSCDILHNRCLKDENGKILFDPEGGGKLVNGKIINGGHLWFPKYLTVKNLLEKSNFKRIKFYHYYNENGFPFIEKIDYRVGFIKRTPDNDKRVQNPYRPLSIVVDCIK